MLTKHGLHIYNTQQQAETKLIDDLAIHILALMFYCGALRDCYCAFCSTAGIHTIINKVTVYFRARDLVFYAVHCV